MAPDFRAFGRLKSAGFSPQHCANTTGSAFAHHFCSTDVCSGYSTADLIRSRRAQTTCCGLKSALRPERAPLERGLQPAALPDRNRLYIRPSLLQDRRLLWLQHCRSDSFTPRTNDLLRTEVRAPTGNNACKNAWHLFRELGSGWRELVERWGRG